MLDYHWLMIEAGDRVSCVRKVSSTCGAPILVRIGRMTQASLGARCTQLVILPCIDITPITLSVTLIAGEGLILMVGLEHIFGFHSRNERGLVLLELLYLRALLSRIDLSFKVVRLVIIGV